MFGWWRDWRERRAGLRGLKKLQSDEEEALMMRTLNPINMAKESLDRGNEAEAVRQWERARVQMPNVSLMSPGLAGNFIGTQALRRSRRVDATARTASIRGIMFI